MKETFSIASPFSPAGDQPEAIKALSRGLRDGARHQTLLGVTGSGKTFTVANVIADYGKPTLVIAHNKTLAAQLASEYREFFPTHAVHYFVSYYDYYQPEAYMPTTDTYIEKEADINAEIDRLRHATTQALLTRRDVVVVASVSCIYGLGSPAAYEREHIKVAIGSPMSRAELIRTLVSIRFERTTVDLTPGLFRAVGNTVEVMPVNESVIFRIELADGRIATLTEIDAITRSVKGERDSFFLFPAKHFMTKDEDLARAIKDISVELTVRLKELEASGLILERERLKRRTEYDLALLREVGYVGGIENYSRHFDGRAKGEPPHTLLSYFPKTAEGAPDFLTIIDESHVTVPQISGMYAGDASRKKTLVEHGFRLPSAKDNRPLTFDEFNARVGPVIYTSATPARYELETSGKHVVEQIIRPTGLVDPEVIVRPIVEKGNFAGQVRDFIDEAELATKRGERTLATVLTKKMAEDLAAFLRERGLKAEYLHSDIQTLERIEILTKLRRGVVDILVGVNLLREGLDLPEVSCIGILDADKEGFLRNDTSLIQTIGRAARNVNGRVILYADNFTASMRRAIEETNRRRERQLAYNAAHGITPVSIQKKIGDITDQLKREHEDAVGTLLALDIELAKSNPQAFIKEKRRQMSEAVKELDFETAAILRDEIKAVESITITPRSKR